MTLLEALHLFITVNLSMSAVFMLLAVSNLAKIALRGNR